MAWRRNLQTKGLNPGPTKEGVLVRIKVNNGSICFQCENILDFLGRFRLSDQLQEVLVEYVQTLKREKQHSGHWFGEFKLVSSVSVGWL